MRPDAFAAVMATGIVSIAADDHGYHFISEVLVVFAVLALPALMVAEAIAWRRESWDLRDPDIAVRLFTYVAACAVLGSRLAESGWPAWVLAGMALQGWVSLMPVVLRQMWRHRWTGLRDRAHGAWELAGVATSGLAIVCADVDVLFWAMVLWVFGLLLYVTMTGLILWRAVHSPATPEIFEPDNWILMGGLAIATLAGDHIHQVLFAGPIADGVRAVTIVTWVLATLWIPPLVFLGLRRINQRVGALTFENVWWAAVFPLGMYSAATYAMSVETTWAALVTVSLVFFWVAFVAWAVVGFGALNWAVTRLSHGGSRRPTDPGTP